MPSHSHSSAISTPRPPTGPHARLQAVPDPASAGAATTPLPSDPLIGRRVGGRYSVERLIGSGGVGLVYLARQPEPPHEVVVKVLAPHWIRNADAEARFDREAARLGAMRHPNIVEMLDHGREGGRAYLVMEYLQGELLRDHLARNGRLSLEAFVPIAAQILKGIGHAHTRELMVRDIKPANIMLCERKGRANFVKLLDFGLAKLLEDDDPVTDEHIINTTKYLTPKVIRGETIDLRVDVYAIGVLFHQMLSGRLPLAGTDSAAIFYRTLEEPAPVLPAELGLPEGLVRLVQRCLAKHPDDRPADANAVVEELIDAVPAHMFRLPRATASTVPAGAGNTGMVELVGHAAVSGPHPVVRREDSGAIVVDTVPIATLETLPSIASVSLSAEAPSRRPNLRPTLRVVALAVAAGALMAVLGGVAAAAMFGDDAGSGDTAAAGLHAAIDDSDAAEEQLAEARKLIDEGRLDRAGEVLDEARGLVGDAPGLQARLERLDRGLLVARLMNSAARFEGEGDVAAAVSAYRDVLAADPTHAVARSRLSRLTTDPSAEPAPSVPTGDVSIDAHPDAELVIDGRRVGSTPYTGPLPVGTHAIRMTARGYQPWEGTIEIAEADNDPIQVRLHGKEWSRTKPTTHKQSAAPAPAAATPAAGPTKKDEREVFLPNKASQRGGGVFLPTKE